MKIQWISLSTDCLLCNKSKPDLKTGINFSRALFV